MKLFRFRFRQRLFMTIITFICAIICGIKFISNEFCIAYNEECCLKQINVDKKYFEYLVEKLRDRPYAGVDNYRLYTIHRLGLQSLKEIQPLRTDLGSYEPIINDVSYRYPIQIQPCKQQSYKSGKSNLFIAVISAAWYFEKRQVIRQTWLKEVINHSSLNLVGFGFILGRTSDSTTQQKIEREHEMYGDIIQVDMIDHYSNMTLKMTGLFNWLNKFCLKVDNIYKVDDDVYVNIRNLAMVLSDIPLNNKRIYGTEIFDNSAQRGQGYI